jgi:glucose/mannose-6-phosphate isomerase
MKPILSSAYQAIDQQAMFNVLVGFPEQVRHGIAIGAEAPYFTDTTPFRSLIFAGMGGSAIGGDLLRCALAAHGVDAFSVGVSRYYELPAGVDASTAVIASSYSGSTEETLAGFDAACAKTQRLLCISTGGELARRAAERSVPLIQIPSGMQPRCAVGYSLFPVLGTLVRNGTLGAKTDELRRATEETLALLTVLAEQYAEPNAANNPAFRLAEQLQGSLPVFYSAPFMEAVNMRWRGQLQENANHLAFGHLVPEMNHNEINGWLLPNPITKHCSIVLLREDAASEHPRVARRFAAMKPILEQRTKQVLEIHAPKAYFLAQMLALVYLADWTSYWLALLNGQDPTAIDDILALKAAMSA